VARALRTSPIDLIATGNYQPAERKFGLSRRMLEVCLERGFPVFVLTRSPLLLRVESLRHFGRILTERHTCPDVR
jgi:DNA repair photolyase